MCIHTGSAVTTGWKGVRRKGRWCVQTQQCLQGAGAPQIGVA